MSCLTFVSVHILLYQYTGNVTTTLLKSRRCRQVGWSVDTDTTGFFIPKVSLRVSHFGHMMKPLHTVDTYASPTQILDIVVFCGHSRLTCHKRLTWKVSPEVVL